MKPIRLIFLVLFSFVLSIVNAQEHSLTVVGGLNMANMSVKYGSSNATVEDSYMMKMAYHGGALFNYVLSKDRKKELSIEPGLLFDAKGFKQELAVGILEQENTLTAHYADIPVYFRYTKKLRSRDKVYVGAGPYLGVGLFGTIKNTYSGDEAGGSSSENISWGSDASDDDMKRLDYGLSARMGYQSYGGLNFSASYDFGLPNVSAADTPEFKHRVFRISLGYSFTFED